MVILVEIEEHAQPLIMEEITFVLVRQDIQEGIAKMVFFHDLMINLQLAYIVTLLKMPACLVLARMVERVTESVMVGVTHLLVQMNIPDTIVMQVDTT